MKLLLFFILALAASHVGAAFLSTFAVATFSLSLVTPAYSFFGMFRRRRPPPPVFMEEPSFSQESAGFNPSFSQAGGFSPSNMGSQGNWAAGSNAPTNGFTGQSRFQPQNNQFPTRFSESDIKAMQEQSMKEVSDLQSLQQQGMPDMPSQNSMQMPPNNFPDMESSDSMPDGTDDIPPGMNAEEAESFFVLLAETDESQCISRLICEMGDNPNSGGEFGKTIVDIIGSLTDFPAGSKVSEYNEVLNAGRMRGSAACLSQYPACDEESFQMVKKAQLDGEGDDS